MDVNCELYAAYDPYHRPPPLKSRPLEATAPATRVLRFNYEDYEQIITHFIMQHCRASAQPDLPLFPCKLTTMFANILN